MPTHDYVPHAPGYVDNDGPKIVTSRFVHEDSHTLERYEATNGYDGLRRALDRTPADVHEEVRDAVVLGRGPRRRCRPHDALDLPTCCRSRIILAAKERRLEADAGPQLQENK